MDDIFYVVTMKTCNNKKLYLACDIGNSCKWIFDKSEACWYNTYKEAEDFCKSYFKNFKNYIIESFNYNYDEDNKSNKFSKEEIEDFHKKFEEGWKALEEEEKRKEEEWNNKTNEEKLAWYEENNIFLAEYIKMSKEELEEALKFNIQKEKELSGIFHDPYYSRMGCLDNIERINKVKKLKGWD